MDFLGTKLGMSVLLVLLTVTVVTSRSIDYLEPELYRPVDFSNGLEDNTPIETGLLKYLLTKELMSRQGNGFEDYGFRAEQNRKQQKPKPQPPQKKYYYKPCAFNAISCFG